jgi:hypothetical protein
MRTTIVVMAVLYLIGQVWYWGFSEGWRQASAETSNSASPEGTWGLAPVPVHPVHSGDTPQVRL